MVTRAGSEAYRPLVITGGDFHLGSSLSHQRQTIERVGLSHLMLASFGYAEAPGIQALGLDRIALVAVDSAHPPQDVGPQRVRVALTEETDGLLVECERPLGVGFLPAEVGQSTRVYKRVGLALAISQEVHLHQSGRV